MCNCVRFGWSEGSDFKVYGYHGFKYTVYLMNISHGYENTKVLPVVYALIGGIIIIY